jgi:hemerythrin-like domain-containing protein
MTPGEVRARVLAEHAELRKQLAAVEAAARRVLGGERTSLGLLRHEGEAFLNRLADHMRWEDAHLAPALRDADAWGEERVRRLDRDHREQRDVLEHCLAAVRDASRPAPVVARVLVDLVQLLRDDMDEEERVALDPAVLRDDIVSPDAEAG